MTGSFTRHFKAFTLIELVVVIVIVGILALIGAASYNVLMGEVQVRAGSAMTMDLAKAMQAHSAANDTPPAPFSGITAAQLAQRLDNVTVDTGRIDTVSFDVSGATGTLSVLFKDGVSCSGVNIDVSKAGVGPSTQPVCVRA